MEFGKKSYFLVTIYVIRDGGGAFLRSDTQALQLGILIENLALALQQPSRVAQEETSQHFYKGV